MMIPATIVPRMVIHLILLFLRLFQKKQDLINRLRKILKLMLIKRAESDQKGNPNIEGGKWALPGGFVQPDETAFTAAVRELEEETGVTGLKIKHFGVYDQWGRDKRGWIISNAHYAIVPENLLAKRKAGDDAAEVELFDMDELIHLDLAFDYQGNYC